MGASPLSLNVKVYVLSLGGIDTNDIQWSLRTSPIKPTCQCWTFQTCCRVQTKHRKNYVYTSKTTKQDKKKKKNIHNTNDETMKLRILRIWQTHIYLWDFMHVSKLRILNTLPKTNIARMEDHLLLSFSNGPFLGDSFNFWGKISNFKSLFSLALKTLDKSWETRVQGDSPTNCLVNSLEF